MGKCKDEMIKLINGEVEKVYIISEFETHYDISKSLQVWKYGKEKDILSYSIVTKNNIKRPYFIKIKNGANFVEKKYVGESMVDDAKLTITTEEEAIDILGLEVLSI